MDEYYHYLFSHPPPPHWKLFHAHCFYYNIKLFQHVHTNHIYTYFVIRPLHYKI